MARPSSRSISFVNLAKEKSKLRSTAPAENAYDTEFENDHNMTQSSDTASLSDREWREKQLLQNKALSKNNKVLQAKVLDMEKRISDLIGENIRLKQRRGEVDVKRQLDEKLKVLEAKVTEKFDGLLAVFREFRESEGLGNLSSQVQFPGVDLDSHNEQNSRTDIAQVLNKPDKEEESLSLISFTGHKEPLQRKRRSFSFRRQTINPITVFQDTPPVIEEVPQLEDEPQSARKQTAVVEEAQHVPNPELSASVGAPEISEEPEGSSDKENVDPMEVPSPIPESAKDPEKPKSQAKAVKKVNRRRTIAVRPQVSDDTENQVPQRRATRAKPAISYKEPSLGKKLRRESEHFVDAVADDYFKNLKKQKLMQRQPLQAKSDNAKMQSQPPETGKDDNAIFDFVGNAARSNRRYTMNS